MSDVHGTIQIITSGMAEPLAIADTVELVRTSTSPSGELRVWPGVVSSEALPEANERVEDEIFAFMAVACVTILPNLEGAGR
ncbi:MAG: hypothetical protein ABR549_10675 [Mycobacteriales bacterium]